MVTMFSEYASSPFTVEQVEVVYEVPVVTGMGGAPLARQLTPDLASRVATASCAAIASVAGAPIAPESCASLCSRMGLHAELLTGDAADVAVAASKSAGGISASSSYRSVGALRVQVPPTRSDVLHECDVIEDVAIAYGYNAVVRTLPKTATTGQQLPVNKLTDHLRRELASAGYDETLTLALVSREDNFDRMQLKDDGKTAVVLANPQRCVGVGLTGSRCCASPTLTPPFPPPPSPRLAARSFRSGARRSCPAC
jgi:phenylalanyl-tRNA synthetase beta chain